MVAASVFSQTMQTFKFFMIVSNPAQDRKEHFPDIDDSPLS